MLHRMKPIGVLSCAVTDPLDALFVAAGTVPAPVEAVQAIVVPAPLLLVSVKLVVLASVKLSLAGARVVALPVVATAEPVNAPRLPSATRRNRPFVNRRFV
jgi:hypothetical protein